MALTEEELNQAKQITEGAILELINLWKMAYKPEDTVDPNSYGTPTGKAVYEAIQSVVGTGDNISVSDNSARNFDVEERGTLIDVSKYVKRIGNVTVLDVIFVPNGSYRDLGDQNIGRNVGSMNTKYISCDFTNIMYRLEETPTTASTLTPDVRGRMTRGWQEPIGAYYAHLAYTFHHAELYERSAYTILFRNAMLFQDYSNKKHYLYLSGLSRSYIDGSPDGSQAARVKMNTNATTEECAKCTISRIVVF